MSLELGDKSPSMVFDDRDLDKAVHEYLQAKSVWINTATEVPDPFVMR